MEAFYKLRIQILLALILISCHKDIIVVTPEIILDTTEISTKLITIDTSDTTLIIRIFNPPINMYDTHIDIEEDGRVDFSFQIEDLWSESYNNCMNQCENDTIQCSCWPSYEYDFHVETSSEINISYSDSISNYVKAYYQYDTIYPSGIWLNKDKNILVYQSPGLCFTNFTNNQDNYFCFRRIISNDTTYGWIEVWINLESEYKIKAMTISH